MWLKLFQGAVWCFGLSALSGHAAENFADPSVPVVTNVVAQRAVGDVVQTLLAVAPAGELAAFARESVPSSGSGSNAAWVLAVQRARASGIALLTNAFAGFVPGSMANAICAAFHTNGRSTRMWERSQIPQGWPNEPPVLRWNTNSLLWGRKGMTAISQVFEGMGAFGQGAITALTRRHGYTRGHHMGPSGLQPHQAGRRIWFCTRDNRLVERRIQFLLVRSGEKGNPGDYSIIFFDEDLPPEIEPMRVVERDKVNRKYFFGDTTRKPMFWALQGGFVSGGMTEWKVPVRGGDSGSPIMVPLPGEVVFFGGITTSPPSPRMQIDMDLLTLRAGLDPGQYQMQWVNVDSYLDF